jgi:murein DD-endopeptidase MepM/ murein hydrolase activator NlpD
MHLSKTKVTKGQPVAQGDLVGLSGNSGWTTGPHLHVQVQQDCGIWWCQSQPFKFVEDPTISAGTQVTSENHCP